VFVGFLTKLRGKKQEVPVQRTEPLTESDIQNWLITHIAAVAQISPEEVEIERPFAEFGMDSMQLFQLSGELQKFLGHEVSEIVAWDYPTIAKLSAHLSSGPEAAAGGEPLSEDELTSMELTPQTTEPRP
jgi:acyl carrier protein